MRSVGNMNPNILITPIRIKLATKFLYFLLALGILIFLYYGVNYATPFKAMELPTTFIDRNISFHIVFIYIYISFYLMFFMSVMGSSKSDSLACAIAIVINTIIASCFFFFFPTKMPAAIYASEEHTHYFLSRIIQSLDIKNNCFPSLHVANAYTAAFFLALKRQFPLKCMIWTWFILISWSVMSTGQHYFYDILGGIAVALISLFVTGRLRNF
jgi:membrane-associated phospholipid phosphatase